VKRRYALLAGLAGAGVLLYIYLHLPAPRSELGDAVGVVRSIPFRPYCAWFVAPTVLGELPTGRVVCAWGRPAHPHRMHELDELSFSALTRRVDWAQRAWRPRDAATYRHDVDSVRAQLARRGGAPTSCLPSGPNDSLTVREWWEFPGFGVQLGATPLVAVQDGRVPGPWDWSIHLVGRPKTAGRRDFVACRHAAASPRRNLPP
jgi:hypothetical protein